MMRAIRSQEHGELLVEKIGEVLIREDVISNDGQPVAFALVVWPKPEGIAQLVSAGAPADEVDMALYRALTERIYKRRLAEQAAAFPDGV